MRTNNTRIVLVLLSLITCSFDAASGADFVLATGPDGKPSSLKSKLITIGDYQKLFKEPNNALSDSSPEVGAFTIFHQLKTDSGASEENGFFRVGDSSGKPLGWLKKEEVVQWKTRYVLEPQVNINDSVFTLYNARKSQGDEEVLVDEPVLLDKPAGQRRLRLAFILEPPKEELGDDTLYSVICLDRAADQTDGGISDIKDKLEELSMEIVFVYEATDAMTWDIQGITLKNNLSKLMNRVADKFKEAKVDDLVRFGIVGFQDRTTALPATPVFVAQPLTTDVEQFKQAANTLKADVIGGDWAEDGLSGLSKAMDLLDADKNSSDHIIYFGFGAPHEHGLGGRHRTWGSTRRYSGNNAIADLYDTANVKIIGHTQNGLTIDTILNRAKPRASSPLTAKTIHTIMSSASYATIQPNLDQSAVDLIKTWIPIATAAGNAANGQAMGEALKKLPGDSAQEIIIRARAAVQLTDFLEVQKYGFERLKYLAQNEKGNFPGYHGQANGTASEYERVADELYNELIKIIDVLQAAKKGDPKAVEQITNSGEVADGKFTSGSFRTASQQMLSEILDQPTFVADAPVRDDDGYLVAYKNVLVGEGELKVFANKLDGMITLFKDRADRSARSDIKKLLADLQKFALETVTGEVLEGKPESELKELITELPLQTSALDMTVQSLSVMDREDFEKWVESIRLSRKRCQDLLDDASKWAALTPTAPQDKFAFIRVEDMP